MKSKKINVGTESNQQNKSSCFLLFWTIFTLYTFQLDEILMNELRLKNVTKHYVQAVVPTLIFVIAYYITI
jgi:hypothetical protein